MAKTETQIILVDSGIKYDNWDNDTVNFAVQMLLSGLPGDVINSYGEALPAVKRQAMDALGYLACTPDYVAYLDTRPSYGPVATKAIEALVNAQQELGAIIHVLDDWREQPLDQPDSTTLNVS